MRQEICFWCNYQRLVSNPDYLVWSENETNQRSLWFAYPCGSIAQRSRVIGHLHYGYAEVHSKCVHVYEPEAAHYRQHVSRGNAGTAVPLQPAARFRVLRRYQWSLLVVHLVRIYNFSVRTVLGITRSHMLTL